MKEEDDERVNEEAEESDAWMADPFPDVKLRCWKVQLSMEVEEEEDKEEEEADIFKIDAFILSDVSSEADVTVSE